MRTRKEKGEGGLRRDHHNNSTSSALERKTGADLHPSKAAGAFHNLLDRPRPSKNLPEPPSCCFYIHTYLKSALRQTNKINFLMQRWRAEVCVCVCRVGG